MTTPNWTSMMHSNPCILYPTDLTAKDALSFQVARELARSLDAELLVVHAAPLKLLNRVAGYRESIQHRLNLLRLSDPYLTITTHLSGGDPASEIVGWANEIRCDAIMMRCSQQNWLVGRLVDNLTQRVKKLVHCPVISVAGNSTVPFITNRSKYGIRSGIDPSERTSLAISQPADLVPAGRVGKSADHRPDEHRWLSQ